MNPDNYRDASLNGTGYDRRPPGAASATTQPPMHAHTAPGAHISAGAGRLPARPGTGSSAKALLIVVLLLSLSALGVAVGTYVHLGSEISQRNAEVAQLRSSSAANAAAVAALKAADKRFITCRDFTSVQNVTGATITPGAGIEVSQAPAATPEHCVGH